MHETIFAKKIIDEAKRHGSVEQITIELGELGHVPPEELLECLKRMVPWKIISKIKPARVKCKCGFQGHPSILERGHDSFMIECPKCKEIPLLVEGIDVILVNVKVH